MDQRRFHSAPEPLQSADSHDHGRESVSSPGEDTPAPRPSRGWTGGPRAAGGRSTGGEMLSSHR